MNPIKSNVTVEGDVPLYYHDTQPYIDADPHPICLEWSVFKSNNGTAAKEAVAKDTTFPTSDIDFTVKVCAITRHLIWEERSNSITGRGKEP